MPNTSGQNEPFVKRFEMAIMQFVILNKAKEGEVTRDNLKQSFRGNMQMSSDHFDHCIQQLVQDGHLKEVGGSKYTVTDDGREDVQKLQNLAIELPNVIGGQGQRQGQQGQGQQQGQRPGMTQTGPSGGGMAGGNLPGGSTGGSRPGGPQNR